MKFERSVCYKMIPWILIYTASGIICKRTAIIFSQKSVLEEGKSVDAFNKEN